LAGTGRWRIFASLRVRKNLEMGAYTREDPAEIRKSMERVFARFQRLKQRLGQFGRTLSGGIPCWPCRSPTGDMWWRRAGSSWKGLRGGYWRSPRSRPPIWAFARSLPHTKLDPVTRRPRPGSGRGLSSLKLRFGCGGRFGLCAKTRNPLRLVSAEVPWRGHTTAHKETLLVRGTKQGYPRRN
jgi:hypothetical protein